MELDQELCRICLRNAGMPGLKNVNIFQTMACEDLVANLLIDCADVEVFDGDGCPQVICSACLISLEQAYSFKNLIRQSDRILKARLGEKDTLQIEILEDDDVPEHPADESNLSEVLGTVKTETVQAWDIQDDMDEEGEIIKEIFCSSPKNEIVEMAEEEVLVEEVDDIEEHQNADLASKKDTDTSCCLCGYGFNSNRTLREHLVETHDIDPDASPIVTQNIRFPCMVCRMESFSSRSLLRKHQRANIKQVCSVCGGEYAMGFLKQHMRMHKPKIEPIARHPCSICQKQIAANQMWVHRKTHEDLAQFECHICGKRFKLKNYLKNHVVRHFPALARVRDKNYACTICNKLFENAYKRNEHFAVHTGEKRYQCEYCDSKFKNTTDRRRHQWLSHTGSPYSCQKCGKQFDRPSLLKNHEANCQSLMVEILEHH